ncbi:toxin-antitoxin system TumE family protein [Desulfotomaculum copahuensis]|uniref:toxin-antitoxin system TumE family protein n=1 Tax=Desulfotomaculum copahuensis TaxID=1838280 RepID=UPI003D08F6D6
MAHKRSPDNEHHHRNIDTYAHHFHNGSENEVTESHVIVNPEKALHQVLDFVRRKFIGSPDQPTE